MSTRLPVHVFLLFLALSTFRLHAENWTPPKGLLDAVRLVESADGRFLVGDDGQSLGPYQFTEAAWLDVSAWRKSRGLRTYSYKRHVWNAAISRAYASDYLKILHRQLERRLKRCPSWGEMYAAYNMGYAAFARCQFRLARVNPITAQRSRQVQAAARMN
jgi:hypothetical protein